MFYRTLTASAVLLLTTGCATRGDEVNKAWQIEPVFNVQHAFRSSQAYYGLGRYHDGSQAWGKAVDAYRKSIAADAQNIEAYNALGVALARLGRVADAETTLRQAVALAPTLGHVRSNLGYVLLLAGKPQDAATELQAAVRQDSGDATAAANLREAQSQVYELARSREALASAVENAVATPAQPAPVALAGPIHAATIAPMPVTAATAVTAAPTAGPAAATASGQASQAAVMAMPSSANGQISTVAALRVYDQPNVASLQGTATAQTVVTGGHPSMGATESMAVAQIAGPTVMTLRAFEQTAAVSTVRAVAGAALAVPAHASGAQVAIGVSAVSFAPAAAGLPVRAFAVPVATKETAAPAATVPTRKPAAVVNAAPMARLEISNGNGITGMAASVGRWLVLQGLSVARLTNQLPYTQQHTLVQYRNGHEQAAQRVAQTLPTTAKLEVARDMQSDVRVVLGRDWQQFAGCLEIQDCQANGTSVALASH